MSTVNNSSGNNNNDASSSAALTLPPRVNHALSSSSPLSHNEKQAASNRQLVKQDSKLISLPPRFKIV